MMQKKQFWKEIIKKTKKKNYSIYKCYIFSIVFVIEINKIITIKSKLKSNMSTNSYNRKLTFNLGEQAKSNWNENIKEIAQFRSALKNICKKNNITLDSYEKSLLNGIMFKVLVTEGNNINPNVIYRDILFSWPNVDIKTYFDHHMIFLSNEMKQPEMSKTMYILEGFKLITLCIGFIIGIYTFMSMEN